MDSVFTDKLNTNYIPTDDEVAVIKKLLDGPDQQLRSLADEIQEIQASLNKLLKEKESITDKVKAHKALLAPSRRLTPDILARIFLHCLPTDRNPVMSAKEAPLLLGRICSKWRDVSLATPQLWSAIHIAIPGDNAPSPPLPPPTGIPAPQPPPNTSSVARVEAIFNWLSSSGSCPLSISVYSPPPGSSTINEYINALLPFASRWKHLHFVLPHHIWTSFLSRIFPNAVPLLEKIYLDNGSSTSYNGSGSYGHTANSHRDSALFYAPNLRSISLIQFDPHILHLPIRWSQLIELNLAGASPSWQPPEGVSITETLSILNLCPDLIYFSVQITMAGYTPLLTGESGLPKVTMRKLNGLAITESGQIDTSILFQHLICPSLKHLKFRRTTPIQYNQPTPYFTNPPLPAPLPPLPPPIPGTVPWQPLGYAIPGTTSNGDGTERRVGLAISLFLKKSEIELEAFDLDACNISERDVMRCLRSMPDLKKLRIWAFTPAYNHGLPAGSSPDSGVFTFEDKQLARFGTFEEVTGVGVKLGADDADDESDEDEDAESKTTTTKGKGKGKEVKKPRILCPHLEDLQIFGARFTDEAFLLFLRSRLTTSASTLPSDSLSLLQDIENLEQSKSRLRKCRVSFAQIRGFSTYSVPASPYPTNPNPVNSSSSTTTSGTSSPTNIPITSSSTSRSASTSTPESTPGDPSSTPKAIPKVILTTSESIDLLRPHLNVLELDYPMQPENAYWMKYSPYDGLPSVPTLGGDPPRMYPGGGSGGGSEEVIGIGSGVGSGIPVFRWSSTF